MHKAKDPEYTEMGAKMGLCRHWLFGFVMTPFNLPSASWLKQRAYSGGVDTPSQVTYLAPTYVYN